MISLQSTTISDFYFGVLGGYNSILNCDKSSFINLRGTAVKMIQARILKMTSSVIQRTDGDGIDIKYIQGKTDAVPEQEFNERKVLI